VLKKTRSILDELDSLKLNKDKHNLVESKASHVIQSAINLINFIKENYSLHEKLKDVYKNLNIGSDFGSI